MICSCERVSSLVPYVSKKRGASGSEQPHVRPKALLLPGQTDAGDLLRQILVSSHGAQSPNQL